MNTMDVNASMHNLPQMERHQEGINRVPVLNQTVNAEVARQEEEQRLERPNETPQAEGKNADSEANKRYHREPAKRKHHNTRSHKKGKVDGSGRFVDITV
jgi:hypothetical protein